MTDERPGSMVATGIGSLPHRQVDAAVRAVLSAFPGLPYWPQLPRRAPEENMYRQFLTGMPGLVERNGSPAVPDWDQFWNELGDLLARYTAGDDSPGAIPPERAAGLWALAGQGERVGKALGIKGQVTGPVSMGLSLPGPDGRPVLYDPRLMEALVSLLELKVRWQERFLRQIHPMTLLFLDEPYLGTVGSAFYAYDARQAREWLDKVLGSASGLTGIHCCANTDWGMLLGLDIDVISFDAYSYFDNFALYVPALREFLERGGCIAWGIVPADGEVIRRESAASLLERLKAQIDALVAAGLPQDRLVRQSLITPSCGLGSLTVEDAETVLRVCGEVSRLAQERFPLRV
ncbi:MAG: methionine synthase [Bacillota bacterium]